MPERLKEENGKPKDHNWPRGRFTRSNFWSQLLLRFKGISFANQDFYELRQCQKIIG